MIVQLLASFTGSLGFCLVFHLRRRYLLPASLGGVLTCGVYLAAASALDGILLPTLTASAFAALYAGIFVKGRNAFIEEILIIQPSFFDII